MSDEKTKYDLVRESFSRKQEAKRIYLRENTQLANLIAHGFKEFLGMPDQYEHKKDGVTSYRSYVPLYEIGEEGTFVEVSHFTDAITHWNDGTFEFGLGLVMEAREGSYPKQVVQTKVKCARANGKAEVTIADESIVCNFDGYESPDIGKVHDLLYGLLNEWLGSRWDEPDSSKKPGFQLG